MNHKTRSNKIYNYMNSFYCFHKFIHQNDIRARDIPYNVYLLTKNLLQ